MTTPKGEKVLRQYDPSSVSKPGEGAAIVRNPLAPSPFTIRDVPQEQFDTTPAADGAVAGAVAGGSAAKLVGWAKKFVGTPYKWGGTGPLGFDCSGFTQYVFKQMGINLPRISYQQGQGGRAVAAGDWQPGDLLFWDNSPRNPGADHVAIYLGNGLMISAPKPGDKVKIQKVYGTPWARRYL